MGLNCDHLHLKGTIQDAVVDALRELFPESEAIVTRNVGGWVTVFHDGCVSDEALGRGLCRRCACPGIYLDIWHSDYLFYLVFDAEGRVEDASDFREAYNRGQTLTPAQESGLGGHPERIAQYARSGVTAAQIRAALEAEHVYRDENLWALAELLGIRKVGMELSDWTRLDAGDDVCGDDPDWQGLRHVVPET